MYARAHTRTRLVNFSTTDHQLRITTYHIASYNGGQKIFKWVIDHPSTTHQYPCLHIQSPPSTPFFSYLITVGVLPSIIGHIVHCVCTTFGQTLENTLAKRWKTPLPNVGKHPCQTLENTFAKRWKILLST